MIRTFIIGSLCGVIMATAVTIVFTIPANSDYWRMEIWKRGSAAWRFDKNGHLTWRRTVKPNYETRPAKRIIVSPSNVDAQSEQL